MLTFPCSQCCLFIPSTKALLLDRPHTCQFLACTTMRKFLSIAPFTLSGCELIFHQVNTPPQPVLSLLQRWASIPFLVPPVINSTLMRLVQELCLSISKKVLYQEVTTTMPFSATVRCRPSGRLVSSTCPWPQNGGILLYKPVAMCYP